MSGNRRRNVQEGQNNNMNFNNQLRQPQPLYGGYSQYEQPIVPPSNVRNFSSFSSYKKRKPFQKKKPSKEEDVSDKVEKLTLKAPTGEHLSKTSSEVKTDPLYKESFFNKLSDDLSEVPTTIKHFTGFSGLPTLINQLHDRIGADNINYKKSVPRSVFAYYCACATWARILYLRKHNRFSVTALDERFINYFYSDDSAYEIPELLHMYLAGVGNFTLPESQVSRFDVKPCTINGEGYFVDMIQRLYVTTSYPCVSIFAQCIMEDIAITANQNLPVAWNPNGVQQQWSERCLGYVPRQILPDSEQLIFSGTNITATSFPTTIDGYRLNTSLLGKVLKFLQSSKIELFPIPRTHIGSVGQQILTYASSVNALDVEIGDISLVATSPVKQNKSISLIAGTFLYRLQKDTTATRGAYFFPFVTAANAANLASVNMLLDDWPAVAVTANYYQNIGFVPNKRYDKSLPISSWKERFI